MAALVCRVCSSRLVYQPSMRGRKGREETLVIATSMGWIVEGDTPFCSQACRDRHDSEAAA